MKTINRSQLIDLLRGINHATPLTITAFTDARLRKTGNPYGEVRKLVRSNGFTGADYMSSVQRQEAREGNAPVFQSGARAWGEKSSPALVEKDGKFYLSFQPRHTSKPTFFRRGIHNELLVVPKSKIADFLPPVRSNAENQGVEKEVIYRNYSLDSIVALSCNGEQYRIRD